MSALPPIATAKADFRASHVRFTPKANICGDQRKQRRPRSETRRCGRLAFEKAQKDCRSDLAHVIALLTTSLDTVGEGLSRRLYHQLG
jgi:hypothetical protein